MNESESTAKIPVGISSCLLGEEVRFDGGHKHNSYVTGTLGKYFEFRPFCPEVEIGLPTARLLARFPHLPVEEEGRLGDARLRENFIKRVFVYQRWKALRQDYRGIKSLTDFHARHKLIYLSHSQHLARDLGNFLAQGHGLAEAALLDEYENRMTSILKKIATRKNHVNVLQHVQGYLKRERDKDDKHEMSEVIEQYRRGQLPLIVPITLLRHHFRRNSDEYIDRSFYMRPHPAEMMLLYAL